MRKASKTSAGVKALMSSMMPAAVARSSPMESSVVKKPKGPQMKSFGKRKSFSIAILLLVLIPLRAQAQTANPTSRLGWSQPGQTVTDASAAGYNLYIDALTVPIPVQSVTCASGGAASPDVQCQAPFPAMPPGAHTISLTQKIGTQESGKSSPLLSITFSVVVTPTGLKIIG